MLDDSNQIVTSEMDFNSFVQKITQLTKTTSSQSTDYAIVEATVDHLDNLENAYQNLSLLAEKKKIASSGIEWFLDNFYVIQEAIELITDDLPKNYFHKLPSAETNDHYPRIYHIARNLIAYYEIEIARRDLNVFLEVYQQDVHLQMSELWALPIMLRLVLIEVLSGIIFNLIGDQEPKKPAIYLNNLRMESDEIVARAIRTLLFIERIDWKTFFERHAKVEKILSGDPAKVYARMAFETRDRYRKIIEDLAENSAVDEIGIAQTVIDLSKNSKDKSEKACHVGYYLLGDGKERLRTKIGYRQGFSRKVQEGFYKHNTIIYLGSIGLITLLVSFTLGLISHLFVERTWQLILLGFLSLIPASSVAVNLINSILTTTLPPKILPKMDFSKQIPRKFRTMVTIPALLTTTEEIDFLLNQLELHYLASRDQNIGYALLTDFSDASEEILPEDDVLLQLIIVGINQLNDRYISDKGRRPFYLFHRCRQWNEKEDAWIGWERKRGKLADFNRYLLEGFDDSFSEIIGELDFLKNVKFVITLDADTVLPRESASCLIATLAHPLNRAEFDPKTNRVTSGYTVLQPRTEVKPTSVDRTHFSRVFAGDLGLDLYTRAVSDVYQDLFDEGSYVGKGIYDVEAFQRSLDDKVPDNSLLSHDLFEGLQGRVGLVSDIVFYEEYPPDYASQVQRRHRWVRGDWQLLPWLFPNVPLKSGNKEPNPFKVIDRWKLFDNLRRSLLEPATLLALATGWTIFSNNAWIWTLLILFISAFPLFNNIITSLSARFILGARSNLIKNIGIAFLRWIFWLIFLPYESLIMIDAIGTTLIRIFISHKRLLQWQTSAHTIRFFGRQLKIATIWQRMISAPLISLFIGVTINIINPNALFCSLPLLFLWAISPQIVYSVSKDLEQDKKTPLKDDDILLLRSIARRTWLYFERFIGPEDHWLPPDHYQEDPKGMVAHRTSPTNIGLLLLSSAAAYDFGFIGVIDFIYRISYTFNTLDELEKYRGHLLNWYDTHNLRTLSPRYVSTVDSGNFAISLIGLYQTLMALSEHALCPNVLFSGVYDSFEVLCNIVDSIDNQALNEYVIPLNALCRKIQNAINAEEKSDERKITLINDLMEHLTEPMNILIQELLSSEKIVDRAVVKDLRYWYDAIFQQVKNIQRQIENLAPWMETWCERPECMAVLKDGPVYAVFKIWFDDHALDLSLSNLPEICSDTITQLDSLLSDEDFQSHLSIDENQNKFVKAWMKGFKQDLIESRESVQGFLRQINTLLERIDFYLKRMEFDFLFDKQREVFYIGYQIGSGRLDKHHYDLLASEARTASLFAIAQNEVPRAHWLHMSRPFTEISGTPTLISWNGSMFEYLMPNLFTKTYPQTLLHQTNLGVIKAQIAYAKKQNVPWGISESSYYLFDQDKNYQYKGFGVPGLGRKRGLADDLVIAPYASLLAVAVDPKATVKNIDALSKEGALGHYGFYESIDYTTSRLPIGQKKAVIKSYMAHHQGMILVALANFINPNTIVDRVHSDPRIQSTELLLQEQIPEAEIIQKVEEVRPTSGGQTGKTVSVSPWRVDLEQPGKAVHVLSNGNLRMLTTETGSGYLEYQDIALTRWRKDAALDPWGIWFYIQDLDKNEIWSIGRQPISTKSDEYRVFYAPHMTEVRHVVDDISVIVQTTITPNEDICLQKITLSNQSSRKRQYRLLSYGEVALAPQVTDQQHPAFNKLFIESCFDEELNMLYFQRRKRSSDEKPSGMGHFLFDDFDGQVEYESDRANFIGRGHDSSNPLSMTNKLDLSRTSGTTLDPIFSVGKRFSLNPHETITVTYGTFAAEDQKSARLLAKHYQNRTHIENAFLSAESHSKNLMRELNLENSQLPKFQALLSLILYPIRQLRSNPDVLEKNELGQSGLWSFGISGDYPILLVIINSQDEIEKLQEILLAHTYWRNLGLMIDMVILNMKDVGYTHELNEKIHQALRIMDSQNWVNRRGGIVVLSVSQVENKTLVLIKTAASVIIDLQIGDIEEHLSQTSLIEPHLPQFVPSTPDRDYSTETSIDRPENLIFDNGIGGFTPNGEEYQIYLKNYPQSLKELGQITPAPWINVIANPEFGCLISETGSGYTWSINSGENRLTPWMNDPVSNPSGESLYLRDEITGKIWTPTPYPSGEGADYLVRHGQGYTIFESKQNGFKQQFKVYVDSTSPVKIMTLTMTNQTEVDRRITATYYAEWVLGASREGTIAFIVPSFDTQSGTLMARNTYSAEFSECVAFLTSNKPVQGLTTNRSEFLDISGGRHNPAGLKRVGLSGNVEAGVDPCAALQSHLNFEPLEEKEIVFILGQGENLEDAKELAKTFSDPEKLSSSWRGVSDHWKAILNTLQVKTPDPAMDIILNRWLLYQTVSCRIWGRSALYQSSGAYGFRDQLQDITSVLAVRPDISREHILRAAGHQFDAGDVLHWWHPPSGRGVRTRITDDLVWLNYVTWEYIRKTNDKSILTEQIPFILGKPLEENEEERYGHYQASEESHTLFEHCRRALEKGDTHGPHGLPLMSGGDWNDGMNRVGIEGRGESVWLAWFLYENHLRFADLCDINEAHASAKEHRIRAKQLLETIESVAWDGEWYLRGFYDDGTPLGSIHNEECQIASLPQSWSILTGNVKNERRKKAIASAEEHLLQKDAQLIRLFYPPFDKTNKHPGYIKGYPPGIRENGGQYTHAAIWLVWALTKLGYGDQAKEWFSFLNPIAHSLDIDAANQYKVEPYVVAADIYSTPPHIGHGGWTWYTGSSSWLYRLGTEAILGFQLLGDHFTINPCIPRNWDGYRMTINWEQTAFVIQVLNPDHVENGIIEILLDEKTMEDKKIPIKNDQLEHHVTVIMGKFST